MAEMKPKAVGNVHISDFSWW